MSHLTYAEAMVVGLLQGVTELFPVSSLGHSVLIPAVIGGSWARDLDVSTSESPYLAYIVGLHVATAIAMIAYFWRDWLRIVRAFFVSLAHRQVEGSDQRLAWMIVLGTIPVGIAGVALEHLFRVVFSRPIPTALFLACNGLILLGGERIRRRREQSAGAGMTTSPMPAPAAVTAGPGGLPGSAAASGEARGAGPPPPAPGVAGSGEAALPRPRPAATPGLGGRHASGQRAARQGEVADAIAADTRLAALGYARAIGIASVQILALLPGISRDGIVMVAGMARGLTREDAARFSFLLSAPVILAAGVLKLPDLTGHLGSGIHGQVLAGSLLSGIGAYVSLRFLMRYFRQSRSLTPFAIYCLVAGLGSAVYLALR